MNFEKPSFNDSEVRAMVEHLDTTVRDKLLKTGLTSVAQLLAERVRENAPVDSGNWQKSIKVVAGRKTKYKRYLQVTVATDPEHPYAAIPDLGSKNQPRQDVFGTSVREIAPVGLNLFILAIREAIANS